MQIKIKCQHFTPYPKLSYVWLGLVLVKLLLELLQKVAFAKGYFLEKIKMSRHTGLMGRGVVCAIVTRMTKCHMGEGV